MRCVVESCETNRRTKKKNNIAGVRFIPFPVTDYANDHLKGLAKKRLHWWCRKCGVDSTMFLLNQLHICSLHFVRGNCAPLWDVYSPDWIPSLDVPAQQPKVEECEEQQVANPLFDQRPDHVSLRTLLIDEIIAYPIGRTYFWLDEETNKSSAAPYDVRYLAKELRKCLTRTSAVGKMVLESNGPHYPERMFSPHNNVTQLDLTLPPRWETEKTITKLQHSVLELINVLDEKS